ncbi:MAG: RnfH family protein [Pseudomonadales bacterium]|nr:RnfH family protein [Pseudomonadales bacterium]
MREDQTTIGVSVVYATPAEQKVVMLELAAGDTIENALAAAQSHLPELDLSTHTVGVYGTVQDRSVVLSDGDRVEIYRPLEIDAKEARRRRALEQQISTPRS